MIHGDEVREKKELAVLCDFDGTITVTDTLEYVMRKFAVGDWKRFDQLYERGEISLQACLRGQGSLVRTPEMVLVAEMERVTQFRPSFDKLVQYCRHNKVPLVAVSAGLDFVIKDLLRMKGWNNLVRLSAAKAECTPEGIKFTFPRLHDRTSLSVKDDLVKYYKAKGRRVAYVGDGILDIHALKEADYRFAIKGSRLAELCRRQGIPAREVSDFLEMVTTIQYDL
jgi:2-hydroxy-3-keto-5-methylthiopentenyl-1-phosphate phosphatase